MTTAVFDVPANDRDVRCNICGSTEFRPFKNRGKIKCVGCSPNERHRLFFMYLNRFADLRPGLSVLHLAPENTHIFKYMVETVGDGYDPRDFDTERYAKFTYGGLRVRHLDLCRAVWPLPLDHYDLIIHNHVLEHLPCSHDTALWNLNRSLKASGLHLFSIPIMSGSYEEDLEETDRRVREEKFGQHDHVRRFGRDNLDESLAMVRNVDAQLKATPLDYFTKEELIQANIPRTRWHRFSGATPFRIGKADLSEPDRRRAAAEGSPAVLSMVPSQDDAEVLAKRMERLENEVTQLQSRVEKISTERDRLERQYTDIVTSRTWRFTAPIRQGFDRLKRPFR